MKNDEQEKDLDLASSLLAEFNKHFDKRNEFFLYGDSNLFEEILRLHYFVWENEWKRISEKRTGPWRAYYTLGRYFDDTLKQIQTRIMTTREHGLHTFFQILKKHLESHADKSAPTKQGEASYLNDFPLFEDFFLTLNEAKDSGRTVWEYFPKEWKVTVENLEKNNVVHKWLVSFMRWCQSEMNKEQYNWTLETTISNFFPSVDPISWAHILIYTLTPPYENRIEMLIENERNFGIVGRIFSGWHGDEKDAFKDLEQSQIVAEDESAKLAAFLTSRYQPFFVAFGKIEETIENLETLKGKYQGDEKKEMKRRRIQNLFLKIQSFQKISL